MKKYTENNTNGIKPSYNKDCEGKNLTMVDNSTAFKATERSTLYCAHTGKLTHLPQIVIIG